MYFDTGLIPSNWRRSVVTGRGEKTKFLDLRVLGNCDARRGRVEARTEESKGAKLEGGERWF